ncbi:MAG: Flp pilus assembly complex ATPase component TadA [Phycisphaerales bacterium]|nr:Flp pilus assembly complex ATPase component TadA [Phycisphaerales bacterium]
MTTLQAKPSGSVNGSGNGAPGLGVRVLSERPDAEAQALAVLSADQAMRLRVVPFRIERRPGSGGVSGGASGGGAAARLHMAMFDPQDLAAADEVSVVAQMPVTRYGMNADLFRDFLRDAYGTTAAEVAARLSGQAGQEADDLVANLEAIDADELHRMAEQPTLINLVNLIILEAIRSRASDVHVEPFEKKLSVKYRVDGVLVEQTPPPKHLQPAITSRIKIMAGMNIAERYVPQDGHITLRFEGRKVDIRVSTVPTIYGESVVMRILDKEAVNLDLESLGMRKPDRDAMQRLIDLPHGMALVTGPTGSGKTTTLYAALSKLYDPSLKIITIEDPVEYELSGVNQIPVNPKRGLTFASGLRSILRQDPDVIMVGEIRDRETADIAVRSALTGHLLFSTLHTNDAVSAVGRMIDMGVEPFLLASVLEGVLAQRLGRRICSACKRAVPIPDTWKHRLADVELALFKDGMSWAGAGCEKCDGSGNKGRLGYYEVLEITPALRSAISQRMNAQELLRLAPSDHETMRRDGLVKASMGLTSIDEVLRATQDADEPAGAQA